MVGAVADEVGAGVIGRLGDDLVALGAGAVDRGGGEPGQRHRRRADLILLGVPLGGDRLGQGRARHD